MKAYLFFILFITNVVVGGNLSKSALLELNPELSDFFVNNIYDSNLDSKTKKRKKAALQRKYREENREKAAARQRKYYEKNKERIAAQKHQYRDENKAKRAEQERYKEDCLISLEINPSISDSENTVEAILKEYFG